MNVASEHALVFSLLSVAKRILSVLSVLVYCRQNVGALLTTSAPTNFDASDLQRQVSKRHNSPFDSLQHHDGWFYLVLQTAQKSIFLCNTIEKENPRLLQKKDGRIGRRDVHALADGRHDEERHRIRNLMQYSPYKGTTTCKM